MSTAAQIANPFDTGRQVARPGNGAMADATSQRAIAEVQAAMVIAKRFPRDPIQAMDRILNACTRPSLAEAALYQYSKGGTDVSGPSIRLAEAIAQQWQNIQFGFTELTRGLDHDGVAFSEVEAYAWDLETNTKRPLVFRVRHWRDTKKGGYAIKEERDIYELVANQAQRRVRACILGVIPGDVVEAAANQCDITLKSKADTSPESVQKMVAAFAAYGVTKEQIEARIQRRVDAIQPAQIIGLKKVYASLRDGMSSPEDWFETADQEEQKKPQGQADAIKGKLRERSQPQQVAPIHDTASEDSQNNKPEGPSDADIAEFERQEAERVAQMEAERTPAPSRRRERKNSLPME